MVKFNAGNVILANLYGTGKRWDYQWKHSVEFVVPTVALHEVKRRGGVLEETNL